MPFKRKRQTALSVLSVLLVIVILFYTIRAYSIQIVNAAKYTNKTSGVTSVMTSVLKAPRGEIIDRYGRKIATNRDGYNVVFNKAYIGDNINDIILALVNLFEASGAEWKDELPITKTAPYTYLEGKSNKKLIKKLELAHYATADNCVKAMVKKYDLKKYNETDRRKIMGVRYGMDIYDFSVSYPYTFAEDISTELMRKVSESGFLLDGVTVEIAPFREYDDTSLAVNLIGTVGPIFAEDWDDEEAGENYKARGYSYNDKVGKSGIEYYAEKYLRGTDGEITYYMDANGKVVEKAITKEPVAGKTVMLTLDKSMQRTAQNALANTITGLQAQGGTAVAGAAVAIKIDSGGVLCAANYPTYDVSTIGQIYDQIKDSKISPLTDRAFKGIYPIGSTIKPIVAIAAIDNGHYQMGEQICCVQTYRYFSQFQPKCMHVHGNIDLKMALSKSCNYFFFELGRRVGGYTLTDYYKQFGLGVKTGVEVDDAKGIILEQKNNQITGDTLQIAIGQLNAFTPLQVANYTATFANGGTHYKATLMDRIVSYDFSEIYKTCKPEVLNTVKISETASKAVKEGMLSVTEDGTGRAALGDYPIKVGGKTGTSQTNSGADHSVFITFAPFENPEIAIAVVLEHGNSGYSAGSVVRSILDSYFYSSASYTGDTVPYVILG